ncbi:MAG: hypothetical protein HYS23_05820 [Geobacter sp.]|nr:hypothetical protein [Geobacter sp.]
MTKYLTIAGAVVIGIVCAFFLFNGTSKALSVNDVGSDPAAFAGTITVTGITAGTSQQDPTIFAIVDKKELQCTTPNCNKILLPVRHKGKLPIIGDEVRVTGSFVSENGGYLFAADKLKVVRHHRIGG